MLYTNFIVVAASFYKNIFSFTYLIPNLIDNNNICYLTLDFQIFIYDIITD